MTVSIDAGHVRAVRGHQGRTFEVMAAQVNNDDGKPVLFSGVPADADPQRTQLNGVLIGLGMTADTEVTILSDGADGPRSLGEAVVLPKTTGLLNQREQRVMIADNCGSSLQLRNLPGDIAVNPGIWRQTLPHGGAPRSLMSKNRAPLLPRRERRDAPR
jgi:hypothetical protein